MALVHRNKRMITRSDLNEHAFDEMFRNELIEQLVDIEFSNDPEDKELIEAFKKVIAYNSVPE